MTITNRPPQPSAMVWDTDGGAHTSSYATPGALITVGRTNYADDFALEIAAGGGTVLIYLDPVIDNAFGRYHDMLINASGFGDPVPRWPGDWEANEFGHLNDFRVGSVLLDKLEGVLELMVAENPHMGGWLLDDVGSRSWFPGFDWASFGSTNQQDYRAGAIAVCEIARAVADRHGLIFVVNGTWGAGTLSAAGGGYPTMGTHGCSLVDGAVIENHDISELTYWSAYSASAQWSTASPVTAGNPLIWVWNINDATNRAAWVAADVCSHALAQPDRYTAEAPWGPFAATGLPRGVVSRNWCPEPVPIPGTAWVSNRALTVTTTVTGFDRPTAARITGTGSGGEHYILAAPGRAAEDQTVTASVSYRTSLDDQVTAYLLYYDTGGGLAGYEEHPDNPITTTAGQVARVTVSGTCPGGTVTAGAQVSLPSSSTGVLDATMGMLENGS